MCGSSGFATDCGNRAGEDYLLGGVHLTCLDDARSSGLLLFSLELSGHNVGMLGLLDIT